MNLQSNQEKKRRHKLTVRMEEGAFITDPAYIKRILRDYQEHLHANNFDSVSEID